MYQQEMDAWAMRTGRPRRARRAPKGSGVKFVGGKFMREMGNGSLISLRNQLQMQTRLHLKGRRKVRFRLKVEGGGEGEGEGAKEEE